MFLGTMDDMTPFFDDLELQKPLSREQIIESLECIRRKQYSDSEKSTLDIDKEVKEIAESMTDTTYRCLDHIKDKYVVQGIQTLEVKLIDEWLYDEYKERGIITDYSLQGEITRQLLTDIDTGDIIFKTKYYDLIYINNNTILISLVEYEIDKKGIKMYLIQEDLENIHYSFSKKVEKVVIPVYLGVKNINFTFNPEFRYAKKTTETDIYYNSFNNLFSESVKIIQPVGKVSTAANMFQNLKIEKVDLTYLDTSEAVSMKQMFENTALQEIDTNQLDFSKVTSVEDMFSSCTDLVSIKLDIQSSEEVDIANLCYNCDILDSAYIKVGAVNGIYGVFENCDNLRDVKLKVQEVLPNVIMQDNHSFDEYNDEDEFSSIIEVENVFNGCSSLKQLDLSTLNIPENIDLIADVISGCTNLESINLKGIKRLNFDHLFVDCCKHLKSIECDDDLQFVYMKNNSLHIVTLTDLSFDDSDESLYTRHWYEETKSFDKIIDLKTDKEVTENTLDKLRDRSRYVSWLERHLFYNIFIGHRDFNIYEVAQEKITVNGKETTKLQFVLDHYSMNNFLNKG